MIEKSQFPHQAAGKVTAETRAQMTEANTRFGVTDGALVRMALESFLPGYLAAQGRPANLELFSKLGAAIEARPDLRAEIERLLLSTKRTRRAA